MNNALDSRRTPSYSTTPQQMLPTESDYTGTFARKPSEKFNKDLTFVKKRVLEDKSAQ